ncbi:11741_t:CDS:2, partial [Cetraspora pellucida]
PESQAIFKRGKYYSVGGKIVPNHYANIIRPKMSVATSSHLIIKDLESSKCPLKVSFVGSLQGKISAIENTEDSKSVIFVVGYIEVINGIFYVNAKDINYVNIKKRISDASSFQTSLISTNSARSKLLNIHQNITKNSKDKPIIQLPNSVNTESRLSAKCKRTEESYEHLSEIENTDSTVDCEPETNENLTKNTKL